MASEQEYYKQAVNFYQSGNLSEAERILRQILVSNPDHAPSLHVMGIIALDVERYDVAEQLVNKAIVLQITNPSYHLTLGRIYNRLNKKELAIESYQTALSLKPDFTDALNNLGTIYLSLGQKDDALEIFNRILKNNPQDFNALCNTASILYQDQKYEESISHYRAAIKINPGNANIYFDIGRAYLDQNQTDQALANFLKATELKPNYIDALLQTGNTYRQNGNLDAALQYYKKIKIIEPNEYAYVGIASIYLEQKNYLGALVEAEEAYKKMPDSSKILNFMGNIHDKKTNYEEALSFYNRAISIDPDVAEFYANKATVLKKLGRLREAVDITQKALEISPYSWVYSNFLLTLVYADFVTADELAKTSRGFGEKISDHLIRERPFSNDKNPDRKLRIGYVSADFCKHSVSYFLSPLQHHDKNNFEIFAYSKTESEDLVTERLKKYFDCWRDIKYMKPDEAADLIEQDKIDILVDLSGHTAHNGLMIFARKPAPIQASWMGYPATTGMKAMDYRITDIHAEPPGMTEHLNTETLWRLPDIFLSYTPKEISPSVIDHPPFEDNGYITFGCFNNFTKVTDAVLQTWARILQRVPNSKILMEISGLSNETIRNDVEKRILAAGITQDQLLLENSKSENQYVLYNKIDIALDPFPCVGGTTSMDTLWMGVPFVSLAGKHFLSRIGVSILNNVGLPELIAQDIDQYISIAAHLAQDQKRLKEIRHNLREKFSQSPAMDNRKFIKNLESAYRAMWKIWVKPH